MTAFGRILFVALAFGATSFAGAQCPQCDAWAQRRIVAPTPAPATQSVAWKSRDDQPGVRHLYLGGVQVGAYRWADDTWQSFDAARQIWGQPQKLFNHMLHASVPAEPLRPLPVTID